MMTPAQRKGLRTSFPLWDGTPYLGGQCVPGRDGGVDCVRFCDAVLQRTFDLSLEPLPRHAQDAAFHSKEIVQEVTKLLFGRFDLYTVKKPSAFLPADLLIVRQIFQSAIAPETPQGHHILVISPSPSICWDAWPRIGVRAVGIGAVRATFEILKVYRSGMAYDKE